MAHVRRPLLVLGLYFVALMVSTHLPPEMVPEEIGTGFHDLETHGGAYAILGGLTLWALWGRRRTDWCHLAVLLGVLTAIAAADELTQPLVRRECSLADWSADAVGVIAAAVVWWVAMRGRHAP